MSRTTLRKKTIMPSANPSACRRCWFASTNTPGKWRRRSPSKTCTSRENIRRRSTGETIQFVPFNKTTVSMRAINIDDLRAAAKRRLPRAIFEFIDGGAQDETTLRANREDFQKWRFRTRTLTDVSTRDQSITLFGQRYASPLILAPTGLAGLLSPRGELAAAPAPEKYGGPDFPSPMSTFTLKGNTPQNAPP